MKIGSNVPYVRVIISESFKQKYQSQEQLLNFGTQSDVFLGHPVLLNHVVRVCFKASTFKVNILDDILCMIFTPK